MSASTRPSLRRDIRDAARIAWPFFRSEERWSAIALLAAVAVSQLALVAVAVRTNIWRNDFFQSLQERSWDGFLVQFWVYSLIGVALIATTVFQQYVTQWLILRWRRWMTARLLARWLDGPTHVRLGARPGSADNPDQRIAEDTKLFITQALGLGSGFLGSVASLVSFAAVLWALSASVPLVLFGRSLAVPGYLLWAALAYAVAGTGLAHAVGRRLIPLTVEQERREADFRYGLVRVRESAEPIALMRGEARERTILADRFAAILANGYRLIARQAGLGLFTGAYRHYSLYFPYLVMSPLYFAGGMPFGALMQAGSAFNEVRSALSYVITAYPRLAELAAATERLSGFEAGLIANRAAPDPQAATGPTGTLLSVRDLRVETPAGDRILAALPELSLRPGERVLVTGPSGSGKSSLVRAFGGLPARIGGHVAVGARRVMILPQRSYGPLGSLRSALFYPGAADALADATLAEILRKVGLPRLVAELDGPGRWDVGLSPGEHQRLGIARALLQRPDLIILDEATSWLDEAAEAALYRLLRERLPEAAILSLATRDALASAHDRTIELRPPGG